jgi:hypothetical protein
MPSIDNQKVLVHKIHNNIEVQSRGAMFGRIPVYNKDGPLRIFFKAKDGYSQITNEDFIVYVSEAADMPDPE